MAADPAIKITYFAAFTTYLGYAVLIVFGLLRDFFARTFSSVSADFDETFYIRRLYGRIKDCWNRPFIQGPPGIRILTSDCQVNTLLLTETKLNFGSYNYLGLADDWLNTCRSTVLSAFRSFNIVTSSPSCELGQTTIHLELEAQMAAFVAKPACVVFNMGFGTNAFSISQLVGKGSLLLSDSLNHASIVSGSRSSSADVRIFRHNDAQHLELLLREALADGQPRSHQPWRKILVMVEGVFSMEGEICSLPSILAVCKRYKAYLYVDEAHSIGALGATGRGVCEFHGVNPKDVDVLMGTFTKSFGAMGGYIAASREIVTALKQRGLGSCFSNALSPILCAQVLAALTVIQSDLGRLKLQRLRNNSNYFRQQLREIGCEVLGDEDSPVIPLLLYNPTKIAAFSRECFKRGLAVVVVGFPATPLVLARARFCVSAGHSRSDIDHALTIIEEVALLLKLRYRLSTFG